MPIELSWSLRVRNGKNSTLEVCKKMEEKRSEDVEADFSWSFGFGSNMDVEFVEKQKQVKVLGE